MWALRDGVGGSWPPTAPKEGVSTKGLPQASAPVSYVRLDCVEIVPSELRVCKSLPALLPGSRPSRESPGGCSVGLGAGGLPWWLSW